MKTKILLLFGILISSSGIFGQIIHVPADQPTIRAGIEAATDGDTVLISDGYYFENISFEGKAIVVASHYIIDDDTSHIWNTIIDGSQPAWGTTVYFGSGEDTTSILTGLTIRGGTGMSVIIYGTEDAQLGGGITCLNSGAKIVKNRIIDNSVIHEFYALGGGIGCYSESEDTWLVVTDNYIQFNSTNAIGDSSWRSAAGGGIYAYSNARICWNIIHFNSCLSTNAADGAGVEIESDPFYADPFIVDFMGNDVQHNVAQGSELAFGGGLSIYYTRMLIKDNIISNNILNSTGISYGGGINLLGWIDLGDEVLIHNNELCGNTTVGGGDSYGVALMIQNPDHRVEVKNNLFDSNDGTENYYSYGTVCIFMYSDDYPGAASEIILDGNIFKNNKAKYGGALYALNSFNFSVTNNIFMSNTAENGGAISLEQDAKKSGGQGNPRVETMSSIANNTFIYNEAQTFGGAIYSIYTSETVATFNNIYWQNQANHGYDIYSSSDLPILVSYSDIDTASIGGTWVGSGNFSEDPLMEEDSIHICNISPCNESGTMNIKYNNLDFNCPETDIDGEDRLLLGGVDIGADECLYPVGLVPHNLTRETSITVYPNPCYDLATISLNLHKPSYCILEVYNSSGLKVGTIANKHLDAGKNEFLWQSNHLPGGIYYLKLSTGSEVNTSKILHIK